MAILNTARLYKEQIRGSLDRHHCSLVGVWNARAVTFRFINVPEPNNNASQIAVAHLFEIHDNFKALCLIFVKIFMGFTQYIVMSVCALVIYIGIRSSMRLKSASFSAGSDKTQKAESSAKSVGPVNTKVDARDIKTGVIKDKKPPQKELLVIKQDLTVVMLQVICTTPGIIVYIFVMIEPRFRMGTEYHNLKFVVYGAVDLSYDVSAFFNFFIYLNFNSKFKNCFYSVFTCRKMSW
ncbi:hypothetical protein PoB_004885900 [Plakobranchus ocellatus]|uniref:G-protein coupled receptors family 1 profile domain-containing protein n=1 Tax=Plakobranchus ocellatus TaxID=259542 RepID=A0AAV4BQD8_9GAST|nr:hypothetical protein PoB_004885900 [Plakobranchus ocellatus]